MIDYHLVIILSMHPTISFKRKLDPSKTVKIKAQSKSHLSQTQPKYNKPLPYELIIKKYYTPVLKQEERFSAFLITRFLTGCRNKDELGITGLLSFYGGGEFLSGYNYKAQNVLRSTISKKVQSENIFTPFPHFFCQLHFIISQNRRRKKNLVSKLNSFKKDDLKSTQVNSKKEIQKVLQIDFSNDMQDDKLNDTQQLGKLSKCLKKILGKQESGKAYKTFIAKMEKKAEGATKAEGMLKFILNLQRDFSSIQQQQNMDFSKESIYGLTDLKKKSDRNNSKLEVKFKQKQKDKRLSTNFQMGRFQFTKKSVKDNDKNSNCHSNSKNSSKSRSRKQIVLGTPEQHGVKSKSKSSAKKGMSKVLVEKKPKLTDTERLYFDEVLEKNEEKIESKIMLKESLRKVECEISKSKKKLVRR